MDIEGAAERGQPVGHSLRAGAMPGARGVKPGPVIGDGEPEAPVGAREADRRAGRARVLGDVLQRLGRRRLSLW